MICNHFECAALFEKCKRFIGRSGAPVGTEVCPDCPNATCNHCSHYIMCGGYPQFRWFGDFKWLK